jgi:hypothetical protein
MKNQTIKYAGILALICLSACTPVKKKKLTTEEMAVALKIKYKPEKGGVQCTPSTVSGTWKRLFLDSQKNRGSAVWTYHPNGKIDCAGKGCSSKLLGKPKSYKSAIIGLLKDKKDQNIGINVFYDKAKMVATCDVVNQNKIIFGDGYQGNGLTFIRVK